jgi:hypothetical protein
MGRNWKERDKKRKKRKYGMRVDRGLEDIGASIDKRSKNNATRKKRARK